MVTAGLLDFLGVENQDQQQTRGLQPNHNILQLLNGNNKPYNSHPNNQRPHPTRPNNQAESNKEQLENLKDRLEKINQKLEERTNNNNNDNTDNDNNDNITYNPVPKPSKINNTNGKNNGNTDTNNNSNNKGNAVISKNNWKKFTKNKFYFQVQPVVPEDEQQALSETVYYQN